MGNSFGFSKVYGVYVDSHVTEVSEMTAGAVVLLEITNFLRS